MTGHIVGERRSIPVNNRSGESGSNHVDGLSRMFHSSLARACDRGRGREGEAVTYE